MKKSWPGMMWQTLKRIHEDEGGVAATEYVIVLSTVTVSSTLSLIGVAAYVKGYRDFLVWWLTHPAV
jgi:Flp pilus assembly pilin Flp